jgi:glycosyltransferase involved in cell wall biosynthesis
LRLLYVINVDWYFCLHWVERAQAMREQGWDIHILVSITAKKNIMMLESQGFSVHRMSLKRTSKNPVVELKTVFQILKAIRNIRPDLVHFITLKPAIYGGFLLKFLKIPSVTSLVGLGIIASTKKKDYLLISFIKVLMKFSLSKTIVLENSADKDAVKDLGLNGPLIVTDGAGVNIDRFIYLPLVESEGIKILFASRLLWTKGLNVLVEACEKLTLEGRKVELHVAGIFDVEAEDAIPHSVIEQWSESQKIVWHGHVSNVPKLIASCDIVCLPTKYGEGIPRILIEAAACGRTIIATDIPGCREIVYNSKNGYLYCPQNEVGLYQSIEKAIQNKGKLSEIGLRGRELVKDRFSNKIIISRWLDIYANVKY